MTAEDTRLTEALKELDRQLWGDESAGSQLRIEEARALLAAINCLADLIKPKNENMDGDRFLDFLRKVSEEIRVRANDLGLYREGRKWAVRAFNCNYDPKAAAYEWLRKQLDKHPTDHPQEDA